MEDWKEVVKSDVHYKNFILLDKPVMFCEMFANQNIPCVQLHSTQVYKVENESYIVGFCGCFKWINDEIIPFDGDSYSENTMIYGYEWFTNENIKYLDILVGEDW